jgi:hypothetical protein
MGFFADGENVARLSTANARIPQMVIEAWYSLFIES